MRLCNGAIGDDLHYWTALHPGMHSNICAVLTVGWFDLAAITHLMTDHASSHWWWCGTHSPELLVHNVCICKLPLSVQFSWHCTGCAMAAHARLDTAILGPRYLMPLHKANGCGVVPSWCVCLAVQPRWSLPHACELVLSVPD